MEPTKHHPFTTRPISDAQLCAIYASDQEMYPAPLSFTRLCSWVDAYPDLGIAFYENGEAVAATDNDDLATGVIIVLPLLRAYWGDLLVGKVKEIDIDPAVMFPPSVEEGKEHENDVEVGLHVFHVERFRRVATVAASSASGVDARKTQDTGSFLGTPRKGFSERAIYEVVQRVDGKCESDPETRAGGKMGRWRICGLSALTATEAGKRTFGRMGFTPTGYKEMFVKTGEGDGEATKLEMVCVYPPGSTTGGVDLPAQCNDVGSEASEMVVKYF